MHIKTTYFFPNYLLLRKLLLQAFLEACLPKVHHITATPIQSSQKSFLCLNKDQHQTFKLSPLAMSDILMLFTMEMMTCKALAWTRSHTNIRNQTAEFKLQYEHSCIYCAPLFWGKDKFIFNFHASFSKHLKVHLLSVTVKQMMQ